MLGHSPTGSAPLGEARDLNDPITLEVAVGAFAATGKSVEMYAARRMYPSPGAFVLTGGPATLHVASADSILRGEFFFNGQSINTRATRLAEVSSGAFALTTEPAELYHNRNLQAAPGAFVLNGFEFQMRLTSKPEVGSFALTGFDLVDAPIHTTFYAGSSEVFTITGGRMRMTRRMAAHRSTTGKGFAFKLDDTLTAGTR